jgi:MFS family permease
MEFQLTTTAFLGACLFGTLSLYLAHRKGRSPYTWFFVGFVFGIFGLLAIFFAPSQKKKPISSAPKPQESTLEELAIQTIQGPIDKFWYYIDPSNQQQGPMSHSALTSAWLEGKLNQSTFVWNEEFADWKTLKDILR